MQRNELGRGVLLLSLAAGVRSASRTTRIAGYSPASVVVDYAYIDQDQKAIYNALCDGPPEPCTTDYPLAYAIYTKGGNSESHATLTMPSGTTGIARGDAVSGKGMDFATTEGTVSSVNGLEVRVEYKIPDDMDYGHAGCRVGALPASDHITDRCFNITEGITIGGTLYNPTAVDNTEAGRTLQGFSTNAEQRFRQCSGCPYWLFDDYSAFYGTDTYGDQFILGALGTPSNGFTPQSTGFPKHNLDFSGLTNAVARYELIEKGIMHLNVWMYVYRMLEVAVDQCTPDCIACNDGAVRSWDGALAFYVGSLEGEAGDLSAGVFPHNQADKRCHNFLTCGPKGGESSGAALVNHNIMRMMQEGQSKLLMGDCDLRDHVRAIVAQMSIPLIQGTLRYAEIMARTGDRQPSNPAKAAAEGISFAAAIVPRIAACKDGGGDAETIWNNMKHGATSTNYGAVKGALEKHYGCLNISCAEVGGFYDHSNQRYNPNSEPCKDPSGWLNLSNEAIIGICVGGGMATLLMCCACCCVWQLIRREKKGTPMFMPLTISPNQNSSARGVALSTPSC